MTDMPDDLREAMQAATRRAADDLVRRARAAAPGRPMPGYVPEPDEDGVYRITDLRDPRDPEKGHPRTHPRHPRTTPSPFIATDPEDS